MLLIAAMIKFIYIRLFAYLLNLAIAVYILMFEKKKKCQYTQLENEQTYINFVAKSL